jgi:hypothetical protein
MPGPGRRLLVLTCAALALGQSACVPATEPTASSELTAAPSAAPERSAAASAAVTPVPTSTSAPTPSPSLDPAALDLEAISCDGGVVLEWSASIAPEFHHYTALRSPEREIEPLYPPIAPAVDWGDTYATDRFVTSAVDASIIPSDTRWFYRVMAYDAEGAVVGASPVRGAQLGEVDELGELEIEDLAGGRTRIGWQPYEGFSRCFSRYRVMFGTGGSASTVLAVVSGQETADVETDALHPDTSYVIRVVAVRDTTLGSFVVAQSELADYSVP